MIKQTLTTALLLSSVFACGSSMATANASLKEDLSKGTSAKEIIDRESNESRTLQDLYVISSKHLNRIVTPFKNPSVKLDDLPNTEWKTKGNIVYLSSKLVGIQIAGFITETGDENSSIKVIFKPMPVPPQEIVLKPGFSFGSQVARDFEQANPRSTTIAKVMAMLANGDLPEGYSIQSPSAQYLPTGCYQQGLVFDFYNGQLASGGDYVVAIGTVQNISNKTIVYNVSNCFGHDGVIANSSFPYDVIAPNQKSEVFVMFYRNKPTARPSSSRKSLLGE